MRLAVIADVHGNLLALDAVIADMAGQGIDRIVNLGDCVSGPLWPRETLDRLRGLGCTTLRGNHDRWVAEDPPETLGRTDAFARDDLDDDGRRWLANLPLRLRFGSVDAFHARPRDDNAYLLEDIVDGRLVPASATTIAARLAAHASRLDGMAARLVLCGHSHLPGLRHLPDGRCIVNPGSVGCPAYDDPTPPAHVSESGSPAARYAVLDIDDVGADASRPLVAFRAIPYDHAAAARRALACDRPDWASALSSGTADVR